METDKVPTPDDIEMALYMINHRNNISDCQFQDWIRDIDNQNLYNELLSYREAIWSNEKLGMPLEEQEWRRFINKKAKIKLYPLWGAVAVAIVTLLIVPIIFWNKQSDNVDSLKVPEFVAHTAPLQITLQADNARPVLIDAPGVSKDIEPGHEGKNIASQLEAVPVSSISTYGNVQTYTLSIPRGKNYHLILEDNTEVWLNADSKLKYPDRFSSDKREVELVGEGYFKVTKDAARPFIVKSPDMTVRVLGTEFNFRSYGSDVAVTLVTGQVSVKSNNNELILNPGQNVSITNDGLQVSEVDVKKYTSWVVGLFYFDNVTLEEIMKDLGRWYNVNIEFTDARTKNYKFKFWANKNKNFEQAVDVLNRVGKVSIEVYGNRAIIREK